MIAIMENYSEGGVMGVDYDGVGGVGILFTEEMRGKLFSNEEWEDDRFGCIEELGITYSPAGSAYSGDEYFYLLIDGETLLEIIENKDKFISDLADKGIIISDSDLKVISDYHVW